MPVYDHLTEKKTSGVAVCDKLFLRDIRFFLCAAILISSSVGISAAERYTYECKVGSESDTFALNGFKLEWTDIGAGMDGIAVAQELREDPNDVTGDHYFLFQPDAYITLDDGGFSNDPESFFSIKGDHNKNTLRGFFLAERVFYSLTIQTWGNGAFHLVKHEACAELRDFKCRDVKLFEGSCASLGVGKEFEPVEASDN